MDGTSATDPPVAADALLASDKDTPTTPSTGTASLRPLRFELFLVRGIRRASMACSEMGWQRMFDVGSTTLCIGGLQD